MWIAHSSSSLRAWSACGAARAPPRRAHRTHPGSRRRGRARARAHPVEIWSARPTIEHAVITMRHALITVMTRLRFGRRALRREHATIEHAVITMRHALITAMVASETLAERAAVALSSSRGSLIPSRDAPSPICDGRVVIIIMSRSNHYYVE